MVFSASQRTSFWVIVLLFAMQIASRPAFSGTTFNGATTAKASGPSIGVREYQQALVERLYRVDEFRYLREFAGKHNVKVYLFGGTAAAFAHYVKWHIMQEQGDSRFLPDRFDYRYINIYRSTQDLDIVVDGPGEVIDLLQSELSKEFPYLQGSKGSKSSWEVRSLKETRGTKIALLNNTDFLNQHTDSQSVGMIDLTEGAAPESVVRDLRQWENLENSNFLKDVLESKIHFYFSPLHETTQFYKAGRNPPILSVIRYFIKIFQLDVEPRPEEEGVIKKIIEEFKPDDYRNNSYLMAWFKNNIPKLLQNAMDVEYATETLMNFQLMDKLKKIDPDTTIGSINWWLNKQPLLTKPIGQKVENSGPVVTAADLKITEVAHETTSFLVYEAITRSHKGLPNVFISRKNGLGEGAAHGDGFYVKVGHNSGFRGTGFTIRFKMHPKAVRGIDFDYVEDVQYVIVHNRAILTLIPENLQLDLQGYYSILLSSEGISKDDEGILHRLRLALRAKFVKPSEQDNRFLESLTKEQVVMILERDSSLEGSILLLERFLKFELSTADILKVMKVMQNKKTAWQREYQSQFQILWEKRPTRTIKSLLLANNPSVAEVQEAFIVEALPQDPDSLLEELVPRLHTLDEIMEFSEFWHDRLHSMSKSSRKLRKWLNVVGRKFYSLLPSEDNIHVFHERINFPQFSLGLAASHFSDPVYFAAAVGQAARMTPQKNGYVGKPFSSKDIEIFWRKQRTRFLAESHSLFDLVAMLGKFSGFEKGQIDLGFYALEHKLFRRRSDVLKFMEEMGQFDSRQIIDGDGEFAALSEGLLKAFMSSPNPSDSELKRFLALGGFLDQNSKTAIYTHPNFRMKSFDDLRTLNYQFPSVWLFDDLLAANLHWIGDANLTIDQTKSMLSLVQFGQSSLGLLKHLAGLAGVRAIDILLQLNPGYFSRAHKAPNRVYFNQLENFWLEQFAIYVRESDPDLSTLLELQNKLASAKIYEVYLMHLATKLTKIKDFDLLSELLPLSRTMVNGLLPFVGEEAILGLNRKVLLPRFVAVLEEIERENRPDEYFSSTTFKFVSRLMGAEKSIFALLRLYLSWGRHSNLSYSSFRSGQTDSLVQFNLANQISGDSEKDKLLKEKLKMFFLAHIDLFEDRYQRFNMALFAFVANSIIMTDTPEVPKVSTKLESQDRDFLGLVYRYFLLLGIRNSSTGIEPILKRDPMEALRGSFLVAGGFKKGPGVLSDLIDPIFDEVVPRYREYLELDQEAMAADSSESQEDSARPKRRTLELQLEREIKQESIKLKQKIAAHPEWKKPFEDLNILSTPVSCQERLKQ